MPRVTQDYLNARRSEILDGAARCFARDGFHATSMQDILDETGLSAGAVYRYFRGKDAIIVAIVQQVLETVGTAFADTARSPDPLPPDQLLVGVLRQLSTLPTLPATLIVQVWSETIRSPELTAVEHEGVGRLIASWATIVETYQQRGMIRSDVPAGHVARTLVACVQGFLVQRAIGLPAEPEAWQNGIQALTSMTPHTERNPTSAPNVN
jgi:TetR/AcrR family transcriptional regulator, transcriptional repressor of aconitase